MLLYIVLGAFSSFIFVSDDFVPLEENINHSEAQATILGVRASGPSWAEIEQMRILEEADKNLKKFNLRSSLPRAVKPRTVQDEDKVDELPYCYKHDSFTQRDLHTQLAIQKKLKEPFFPNKKAQ